MPKELALKACPHCGIIVLGENEFCKVCESVLVTVGATTRGDGSVVFYELT